MVIKTTTTNSLSGFCSAWLSDSCGKHIGNFKLFLKTWRTDRNQGHSKKPNFGLDDDPKKAKRLSNSGANLHARLLVGLFITTDKIPLMEGRESKRRQSWSRTPRWKNISLHQDAKVIKFPQTHDQSKTHQLPVHHNTSNTFTLDYPDSPLSPDRSRGWWECLSGCERITGHTFHDQNRWSLKMGAAEHEPPPTPPRRPGISSVL